MKLNLPQEEAEQCVRKVRERQMGYWFENMEKMDIQAERQNTAEARAELDKARQELVKAEKNADEAKKEANEAKREADEALKQGIKAVIEICQEFGLSRKETYIKTSEKIKETYKDLSEGEIETALEAVISNYEY